MTKTPEQIAEIAKGLSEAQRQAVLFCEDVGNGRFPYQLHGLKKLGILGMQDVQKSNVVIRALRLTPLGLALRAHLQENDDA